MNLIINAITNWNNPHYKIQIGVDCVSMPADCKGVNLINSFSGKKALFPTEGKFENYGRMMNKLNICSIMYKNKSGHSFD